MKREQVTNLSPQNIKVQFAKLNPLREFSSFKPLFFKEGIGGDY